MGIARGIGRFADDGGVGESLSRIDSLTSCRAATAGICTGICFGAGEGTGFLRGLGVGFLPTITFSLPRSDLPEDSWSF